MEFIKELAEARMTRDPQNQRVMSYSDCCERLYLSLLILELMRNYPSAAKMVQGYSKKSVHSTYKFFKTAGTDLHNLIYFVKGDEEALAKLKDPGAARRIQARSTLPLSDIKSYLVAVGNGMIPTNVQQMFIRVENGLNVTNSDYKGIRRSLGRIENMKNIRSQMTIATKLLYAARAKLRSSDLIDDFSTLVAIKDLEAKRVIDPEPTISKPDLMPTTDPSYVFYRLIAKPQNLILIKAFLEHIRDGKPIPSNQVRAYAPVAKLMDDIVRAGPSYINMLKSIHNRAKKTLNR
tara:strand:- start:57 stop:932 length:876 start_codon:yes stop_codon:yes gene_type:complete